MLKGESGFDDVEGLEWRGDTEPWRRRESGL